MIKTYTLFSNKVLFFLVILITGYYSDVFSQASKNPALKGIIDIPTAGSLQRGSFNVGLRMYPQGGVLCNMSAGLINRVMVTVFYGGENCIGDGEINWNPQIGFEMRIRVIEESFVLPALSVGFISQGYGGYNNDLSRYTYKSKGFYTVISRNYNLLGDLGLHFGANKSLEEDDRDKDINLFTGFDKALPGGIVILGEYDFGFNDNGDLGLGSGNGYLNAGLKWSITGGFSVTFIFRNLAKNKKLTSGIGREIAINYVRTF
ncbi:hypothetical protein ACFL40_00575 [candidate division KSB1 bacterium]